MFNRVPWSLSHVVLTRCEQHRVCFYSAECCPNHAVVAPERGTGTGSWVLLALREMGQVWHDGAGSLCAVPLLGTCCFLLISLFIDQKECSCSVCIFSHENFILCSIWLKKKLEQSCIRRAFMCMPNGGRDSFKGFFGMALQQWHQYLFKAALRSWAVLTFPGLLLGRCQGWAPQAVL